MLVPSFLEGLRENNAYRNELYEIIILSFRHYRGGWKSGQFYLKLFGYEKKLVFIFIGLVGLLVGHFITYFILSSNYKEKLATVKKAPKVSFSELKDLKYSLNTKDKEIQSLQAQNTALEIENLELLKIASKELLTFQNDELGFSFSYPAWFGKLNFDIGNAETGKGFYGSFENVALEFGGTTKDFRAGREGWPTDYNGDSVCPEKTTKTLPIRGGVVMLLRGNGNEPFDWFPEGTFGAFVKLNNKEFHGLAFQSGMTSQHQNDDKKITLDEFESLLKTLVIQ